MSRVVGSLDDGRVSFGDRAAVEDARAVDPVCGMSLVRADAVAASDYHGQLFFFCTETCKHRFEAEPQQYAAAAAAGEHAPST